MLSIDLSGQNILITGAGRGMGNAIAKALGTAGGRIALHCGKSAENAEQTAQDIGNGSRVFQADLSVIQECKQLFDRVTKQFGHIDAIVNNAGVCPIVPLASDNWSDEWDRAMAVNLRATGFLCKEAILHFQKNKGGGRIVNIASRAAFRGDTGECLGYAASKGGVVSLSKSIAREYGKDNIVCFVIAPGWVRTDMAKEAIDEYGEDFIVNNIALNRITEPEDICPMVTLLLSGMADHATGATIDINAGSYVH